MPVTVAHASAQTGTRPVSGSTYEVNLLTAGLAGIGAIRFNITDDLLPLSATLRVRANGDQVPTDGLRVYFLDSNASPVFSDSYLPGSTSDPELFVGEFRAQNISDDQWLEIPLRLSAISTRLTQPENIHNDNLSFILRSNSTHNITVGYWLAGFDQAGEAPELVLSQVAVRNTERFSVAGRRIGERWKVCPRDGFPYPENEFVRDAENPSLFVSRRNSDKQGRRDTRRMPREREPRLWPRI